MKPHISVIVPALNEEKLIGLCLNSVVNQAYPREKFEVIVVDGNSTDKTVEIAKKITDHVLVFDDIHTIAETRQRGVAEAKGEILAFIDSDSIAEMGWLTSIDELFTNPKLVALSGVAVPITKSSWVSFLFSLYNVFMRLHGVIGVVLPWGFNMAVRKDAFEAVGGFNIDLKTTEDWDLSLRLKEKFGKQSISYSQKMRVRTSTRKQEKVQNLVNYVWDGVKNYTNIVILNRKVVTAQRIIR